MNVSTPHELILRTRPELRADTLLEGEIELLLAILPELLQKLDESPSAERCAVR